jgi:hypothetical protein
MHTASTTDEAAQRHDPVSQIAERSVHDILILQIREQLATPVPWVSSL